MKYIVSILLICNFIEAAEGPLLLQVNPITPIQQLSLLSSVRKGTLKVHETWYQCPSFIERLEESSTFLVPHQQAHDFFSSVLCAPPLRVKYAAQHEKKYSEFLTKHLTMWHDEEYSPQIQGEYLVWLTQELKNALIASEALACINALVNNDVPLAKKYLDFLSTYHKAITTPSKN